MPIERGRTYGKVPGQSPATGWCCEHRTGPGDGRLSGVDVEQSTDERWRWVVTHQGAYEVSDCGRVRSVDRITTAGHRVRGRVLAQSVTKSGYLQVTLSSPRRSVQVHRLVLEAFVGPAPDNADGCHNNSERQDNRVSNLRWDSRSGNLRDAVVLGTLWNMKKEHCPRRHLLKEPNLTGTYAKARHRRCLACDRANRRIKRRAQLGYEQPTEARLQRESDWEYEQIMVGGKVRGVRTGPRYSEQSSGLE